jgi:hypothetical protein
MLGHAGVQRLGPCHAGFCGKGSRQAAQGAYQLHEWLGHVGVQPAEGPQGKG